MSTPKYAVCTRFWNGRCIITQFNTLEAAQRHSQAMLQFKGSVTYLGELVELLQGIEQPDEED